MRIILYDKNKKNKYHLNFLVNFDYIKKKLI